MRGRLLIPFTFFISFYYKLDKQSMNERDTRLSSYSLPFLSPTEPFFHNIPHIFLSSLLWAAGKDIISALPTEQLTNENHPYAGFLLIINHEDVTIKLFAHPRMRLRPNCFHTGFIDRKSSGHHNRTVHAYFFVRVLPWCIRSPISKRDLEQALLLHAVSSIWQHSIWDLCWILNRTSVNNDGGKKLSEELCCSKLCMLTGQCVNQWG